jgi:hypothetical protein
MSATDTGRTLRRWGLVAAGFAVTACRPAGSSDGAGHSSGTMTEPQPASLGTPGWVEPADSPPRPVEPAPRPAELTQPLVVGNSTRVELTDIVIQAAALARRMEPEVELMEVGADPIHNGLVDVLSPGTVVWMSFNYVTRNPGQPPGKDVTKGSIGVSLVGTTLKARQKGFWDFGQEAYGVVPLPPCPVGTAWKAVLASGVPSDAVAKVHTWPEIARRDHVWRFSVAGHDEYDREVDVRTCALRERGAGNAVQPGSAKPSSKADPASTPGVADPWAWKPHGAPKPAPASSR